MAVVPRPVYALVLVFSTSDAFEKQKKADEATRLAYTGKGDGEGVIWLFAILPSVCNGDAKNMIPPASTLAALLEKSHKNNRLYEMDGRMKGPIDKGITLKEDEDLFNESGPSLVKEFIKREQDGNPSFSLMALVPATDSHV
ncbi:hypothetical protein F5146DRAFT_1124706 [Armillaria mellea]|nr:hypothetical protein F5146DRAFT_1124706 [Armillaria mellea]